MKEKHTCTGVFKVPVSPRDIASSLPVFEVNKPGFLKEHTKYELI